MASAQDLQSPARRCSLPPTGMTLSSVVNCVLELLEAVRQLANATKIDLWIRIGLPRGTHGGRMVAVSVALAGEPRCRTRFLWSRRTDCGSTGCEGRKFRRAGPQRRSASSAVDWMRIRRDGTGMVNGNACVEARSLRTSKVHVAGSSSLAQRATSAPYMTSSIRSLPLWSTPTCMTTDRRFAWLNRAQGVGVGRVEMNALRGKYDVYVIQVGPRQYAE
jgi:Protein of unknown function (DUF3237)